MTGFKADVQIVGAGIVGASIAYALSTLGLAVQLIEANSEMGAGATSAALGGITPQSESFCRGPLRHIAKWSTELYPEFLAELEGSTRQSVPVLRTGQLQVALDDFELNRILNKLVPVWDSEGFVTVVLDHKETLSLEPLLTPNLAGSVLLPIEVALEPAALMKALRTALDSSPLVALRFECCVTNLTEEQDRVRVHFTDGTTTDSDYVVVCGGLASRLLIPVLADKMFPMKGQALEFRSPASSYPLNHHVYCANGGPSRSAYILPREDGRLAGGVTYESLNSDPSIDPLMITEIVSGIAELCPATSSWPVTRRWAGVRPASIDGRPYIGYVGDHSRVIACAGHQGLGVTLAPVSAHLVAQLLLVDDSHRSSRTVEALGICDPYRQPERHETQVG